MKRYPILKSIHEFLEDNQITVWDMEKQKKEGYDIKNKYVLFEKEGVGHIAILMTNHEQYELVSYNERTGEYQSMFGHTEEFIDEIMADHMN